MNTFSKLLISSVIIAGLSGCASTRGLVSLKPPEKPKTALTASTKTAVIQLVRD